MSFIGNVIWIVFGGFFVFLGYFIGGLAMCLTIIGAPIGWAYMKIGFASLAPFGKDIVTTHNAESALYWILNILWFIFVGVYMVINHLFWALIFGITIIGLPFAKQHLKLIPISAMPYGRSLA